MTTPVFDPLTRTTRARDTTEPSRTTHRRRYSQASRRRRISDEVNARPDRHWYPSDPDEAGVDDAASDADSSDEPGDEGSVASAHDGHSSDEDQGSEDEGSDYDGSDYETYVAASSEVSGLEFAEAADSDAEGVPDNNEADRPANRDEARPVRSTTWRARARSTSLAARANPTGWWRSETHGRARGSTGELPSRLASAPRWPFRIRCTTGSNASRAEQFRAEFLTFARRAQHAYPELAQAEQWTAQEVGLWWREYRMREFGQWLSALGRTEDTDGPLDE